MVKLRRAIIGRYSHNKEPSIELINKYDWDSEVIIWLKKRRKELMQKLLVEVSTSYYEHIN